MRKFFCICLFTVVFFFGEISFAKIIEGGVVYNTDTAREYVQEGIPRDFTFSGHVYFDNTNIQKALYTYSTDGSVIGITVVYKGESDVAYIYGRDRRLKYVDKYDRNINLYPHRGYRYDLAGNLILTSLTVSKKELFRFSPSGELIIHSIGGVIYDENGKVLGRAK